MKKAIILLLIFSLVIGLCACNSKTNEQNESVTAIKFSQTVEDLKELDGKQVKINGFMSLLSPLNGELIYLMNIPFQNCPYCVPNTNTLSNTIAIQGSDIQFTQQPVQIIGTLVFGDFIDDYGYEYPYRIENATINILNEEEISKTMRVYYTLSENDYIGDVYVALSNMDNLAYYEDYGMVAEDFDTMGPIPFDRYQEIFDTINNLNKNGEYDDFLSLLNDTKKTMDEINQSIVEKEHDKFTTYQDDVDALFGRFFEFINKYEF